MSARSRFGPFAFVLSALLLVALALGALAALVPRGDAFALRWTLIGFGLMASVGIASGASLVRSHGRAAHGFFVALGATTLARLGLAALGAWGAVAAGDGAVAPYLVGLAAGYVPLQLLEVGWILGRTRTA
jgi:hypothetical protein